MNWINTEDELPKRGEVVLCRDNYGGVALGSHDGKIWDPSMDMLDIDYVTYGGGGTLLMDQDIFWWMPIPKLLLQPKE